MNRFRFRLENVLKVRAAREEEKKREFGVAQSHLVQEEARYREIEDAISEHDAYRAEHGSGAITAHEMIQHFFFSRKLHHRRDQQGEQVNKAQKTADEKRERMVDAMKERKTLERLKERKREQYEEEARHEEQALIDEIASQRRRPDSSGA